MSDDLQNRVQKSIAAFEAMSPIDKAIHRTQQKMNFVRGNIGIDTEWTPAHQKALEEDPAVVLMNEVLRVREVATSQIKALLRSEPGKP